MKKKFLLPGIICCIQFGFNAQAQIDLVYDLHPTGGSYPATLSEFQGKLYFFSAVTATYGGERYKYTPTTNSLDRLSDITPGPANPMAKDKFGVFDNKLLIKVNEVEDNIARYDITASTFGMLGLTLMASCICLPITVQMDMSCLCWKQMHLAVSAMYGMMAKSISGPTLQMIW